MLIDCLIERQSRTNELYYPLFRRVFQAFSVPKSSPHYSELDSGEVFLAPSYSTHTVDSVELVLFSQEGSSSAVC